MSTLIACDGRAGLFRCRYHTLHLDLYQRPSPRGSELAGPALSLQGLGREQRPSTLVPWTECPSPATCAPDSSPRRIGVGAWCTTTTSRRAIAPRRRRGPVGGSRLEATAGGQYGRARTTWTASRGSGSSGDGRPITMAKWGRTGPSKGLYETPLRQVPPHVDRPPAPSPSPTRPHSRLP